MFGVEYSSRCEGYFLLEKGAIQLSHSAIDRRPKHGCNVVFHGLEKCGSQCAKRLDHPMVKISLERLEMADIAGKAERVCSPTG